MEQQTSHNRQLVYSAFEAGAVRRDHCDGKHILFEFSASLSFPNSEVGRAEEAIDWIMGLFPICPGLIHIIDSCLPDSSAFLGLHWQYQHPIVLRSEKEYLDLALDFADYLDSLHIPGLTLNVASFNDEPVKLRHGQLADHDGNFNERYFGCKPADMKVVEEFELSLLSSAVEGIQS